MTDVLRCRYSVVKYSHDPMRQEPINVGVLIWPIASPDELQWRFDGTMKRVERLYPSANPRAVKAAIAAFKDRVAGNPEASFELGTGSISMTEPRAVRCADVEVELTDLFETYVAPAPIDNDEPRELHRSARFIKGRMNEMFKRLGVLRAIATAELRKVECKSGVNHTFDFAYQNGAVHRVDTISFDHGTNSERIARARSFANLVYDVAETNTQGRVEAVVQIPTEALASEVYEQAKKILKSQPMTIVEVRDDADLEAYCAQTKAVLEAHSP